MLVSLINIYFILMVKLEILGNEQAGLLDCQHQGIFWKLLISGVARLLLLS